MNIKRIPVAEQNEQELQWWIERNGQRAIQWTYNRINHRTELAKLEHHLYCTISILDKNVLCVKTRLSRAIRANINILQGNSETGFTTDF